MAATATSSEFSKTISDAASGILAHNNASIRKEFPQSSSIAGSGSDGNGNKNSRSLGVTGTSLEQRKNPFTYHDNFGAYEIFKFILGIFILIPIRLFLFIFFLFLASIFATIGTLGRSSSSKTPLGPIRRFFGLMALLFARAILFFVFSVHWIHIKGKRAKRDDAPIVVPAPHRTVMDAFVIAWVLNLPSFVGKKEITKMPFFGSLALVTNSVLVDRKSKSAKKDTLDAIKTRASSPGFPPLVIFPEGTCTNGTVLINFKHGAFSAGRPVQPLVLRFPYTHFDPSWTAGANRNFLFFRLLCQFHTPAYVEFLPPYVPNNEELQNPDVYAEHVRNAMAQSLGIPVTEHSYEDMFFAAASKKIGLSPDSTMPYELVELKKLYNISYDEAIALLKRFRKGMPAKVKKDQEATVSIEEFAKLLGIPVSDALVELFGLLDTTGSGRINFTRFVVGLSFLSAQTTTDDACKILFMALDRAETGKIPVAKLRKVLVKIFKNPNKKTLDALMKECDPKNTGFVDLESFKKMLKKHPEYLYVAIHVTSNDGNLSEMSSQDAKSNLVDKKRAQEERDIELGKLAPKNPEQRSSIVAALPTDSELPFSSPLTQEP